MKTSKEEFFAGVEQEIEAITDMVNQRMKETDLSESEAKRIYKTMEEDFSMMRRRAEDWWAEKDNRSG